MSTNNTSNTHIIHAIPVDPLTGSISVPIYQTATFVQDAPGVNKGYDYGRSGNAKTQSHKEIQETIIF